MEACEPDPIDASFYHVSKENLLTLAAAASYDAATIESLSRHPK